MRSRVRLWVRLIQLSIARLPKYSIGALLALVGSIGVLPFTALAMRELVIGVGQSHGGLALAAAVAVGLGYALSLSIDNITDSLVRTAMDQLGRLHINPQTVEDICAIDGIEHIERSEFLDRLSIVRSGASRIAGTLWNPVVVVANFLKISLTTVLLGMINPLLLLLALLATAPIFADRLGERHIKATELRTSDAFRLQQHLFEVLTGAGSSKEVIVAGAARRLRARREGEWDALQRLRVRAQIGASGMRIAGWMVFVGAFVGALALVLSESTGADTAVGDIVLAVIVAASLRTSVQVAVDSVSRATAVGRFVEPYLWLTDYVGTHGETGTSDAPDRMVHGVSLQQLSFRYEGASKNALSDITADIPSGSVVAIVGEYGSGKSTLVKLLQKFYRPTEGLILVDGVPLDEVASRTLRAKSSGVFQDFGRFQVTMRESVGIGEVSAIGDDERIRGALRSAGAEQFADRLPAGLATQLGVELGGIDLSEGQWQRTALARAAMRSSPILLVLDEPTASLDAEAEEYIFGRFRDLSRQAASASGGVTILVSHRFSTVTTADLILVLKHGRIVERGSHAQLMDAGGEYAELYRLQVKAYD